MTASAAVLLAAGRTRLPPFEERKVDLEGTSRTEERVADVHDARSAANRALGAPGTFIPWRVSAFPRCVGRHSPLPR